MRDELAHVRDLRAERRARIIRENEQMLAGLYKKYPDLGQITKDIELAKQQVIAQAISRMRGNDIQQGVVELEGQLAKLRVQRAELLKQHGLSAAALEPKWHCALCQDTGRIYLDENTVRDCDCAQLGRASSRQQSVGLPPRLADAGFASVNYDLYPAKYRTQAKKVFAYVQAYCKKQQDSLGGQGLFIHGGTGSGKSFLLGCIANHLIASLTVKYVVYADFLDNLRSSFGSRDTSLEQDLTYRINNVDLLLLDDLGVEKPTEFALKSLAQIIDYRYRNCKPIVVTSNFTLEELKNRTQNDLYGERVVWRLIETCNILNLDGNIRLNL